MYCCLHSSNSYLTPFCLRGSCMCRLTLSVLSFPIKIPQDNLSFSGSGFMAVFAVTLLSLQPVVPVFAPLLFGSAHLFPWLWSKLNCQLKGIFQLFWSSVQLHSQLCQQHGECGGWGLPQPLEVKPQPPWLNRNAPRRHRTTNGLSGRSARGRWTSRVCAVRSSSTQ